MIEILSRNQAKYLAYKINVDSESLLPDPLLLRKVTNIFYFNLPRQMHITNQLISDIIRIIYANIHIEIKQVLC